MKIDFDAYGISYRQFDHYCRKGWIRSSTDGGSGTQRDFPKSESDIFKIMASLVTIGFRPACAAELARSCVDKGWNGQLRLFRGRLEATGILAASGTDLRPVPSTQAGDSGSEPGKVKVGLSKSKFDRTLGIGIGSTQLERVSESELRRVQARDYRGDKRAEGDNRCRAPAFQRTPREGNAGLPRGAREQEHRIRSRRNRQGDRSGVPILNSNRSRECVPRLRGCAAPESHWRPTPSAPP
jgi:hypothetical protein